MPKDKNDHKQQDSAIDLDIESLQSRIADLESELAQEKNAKLLALADFDNYRKRVERERSDLLLSANMSIFNSLADLIDDFTRLVSDLEKPGQEDKVDAFKPVLDKAKGILADYGIVEIQVEPGQKLDPISMEAIGTVKVEEDSQDNAVVHVAQTGYKHRDKDLIVRHTRVIVGKIN